VINISGRVASDYVGVRAEESSEDIQFGLTSRIEERFSSRVFARLSKVFFQSPFLRFVSYP
jgi:hypothetical protein